MSTGYHHEAILKAQVVLVSVEGDKVAAEFARQFGVHASRIAEGKQQLQAQVADVFGRMSRPPEAPGLKVLYAKV